MEEQNKRILRLTLSVRGNLQLMHELEMRLPGAMVPQVFVNGTYLGVSDGGHSTFLLLLCDVAM